MVRILSLALVLLFSAHIIYAQEIDFPASIARTYVIVDVEAEPGDIVAFDEVTKTYRLARIGDPVTIGVIVSNPPILLETDATGLPVVQSGEVLVNVSTLGGTIEAGSPIEVSAIPGKGQLAGNHSRSIGVTRESFVTATTTIEVEGVEIAVGSVPVLLGGISPQADNEMPPDPELDPKGTVPQAFKYVMALLIAVGSVYVSFRSFGANIRSGIISIGRNPLAKTSIQAMVVLNVILVVLVAGGGLLLSIAVLLLPF